MNQMLTSFVVTMSMLLAAVGAMAAPASASRALLMPSCAAFSSDEAVYELCQSAAVQETELRQALEHVLPSLLPDDREALSNDQIQWERALDGNCFRFNDNTREYEDPFPTTRSDFECLTDRLSFRARVVRAMAPDADAATLEGEYVTWMGAGGLRILEQSGGKASFDLGVVEGSSTGGIDGVIDVADDGQSATFVDPENHECRLKFSLGPRALEVKEEDCRGWRGAGAPGFGGTYYRMAPDPHAESTSD